MFREVMPLVAALLAAAAIYIRREQRRRRMRVAPPRPRIAMREVCDTPALLDIERACLSAPDPRLAFRQAALKTAVGALYLETVAECGVPDTGEMLREYTQTWQALREYQRLKYDDAAPSDWFEHFVSVARPYIREKVRLTREFALHLDEGSGRFARIYDELLEQLFQEALAAPQKKTYVPPDFSQS